MDNDDAGDDDDEEEERPKKKSGCGLGALIAGLVVGGAVVCLACCGGAAMFGMNVVAEQVADDLRGNPVLEEHIGPITSIETNWVKSMAAGGDDEGLEVMVHCRLIGV